MNEQRKRELQRRISELKSELHDLEEELRHVESEETSSSKLPMYLDEYRRYGRQMILPGFGLQGQLNMRRAKVLIVGAGGLGCPVMLYLAGAGVGHMTVIDSDTVEISNLHRQVLHSCDRVGMSKAESAKIGMQGLNPRVDIDAIDTRFTKDTLQMVDLASFTLVIDCTDNARTRYLLSDACVHADVILVSGGAVGLEGWSGVWNLPPTAENVHNGVNGRGPCLRCIYPQTKHDNSGNCEDEGVLGTVTGVIGTLMANEAIKLIVGMHELKPAMTLFSPLSTPMFRNLKLRGRKPGCPGCDAAASSSIPNYDDIIEMCGIPEEDTDARASAEELHEALQSGKRLQIIDVRPEIEYGICSIPGSLNIPHSRILRDPWLLTNQIDSSDNSIYLVCRRGNDSLLDARTLSKSLSGSSASIKDLRGGLRAWSSIQKDFPAY